MQEISAAAIYFSQPGKLNTQRTLQLVAQRADQLNIKTILVATTSGETAVQAAKMLPGKRLIAVSHAAGFRSENTQELTPENRAALEAAGVTILTCQHALGGVNRAVRKQLGGIESDEIIANTLRIFQQGMKVIVEIAIMTADAGLVDCKKPVITVAGTGQGADLAAVVLPVNTYNFFDIRVVETICRPAPEHPQFHENYLRVPASLE